MYCSYYQAHVVPSSCWFVLATLKSFEHLAFDRTIDVANSIVEFFVPPSNETYFLEIMHYFEKEGFVNNVQKLTNRLMSDNVC